MYGKQWYGQPVSWMLAEILLIPVVWAIVSGAISNRRKIEAMANCCLILVALYEILQYTLLNRTPVGLAELKRSPFQVVWAAAFRNREIIRSLLLNVLMFEPFGAALVNLQPERRTVRRRIILTLLFGLAFSFVIEGCQYYSRLGSAEADDVICNTIGTMIGALSLPLKHVFKKQRE